MGTSSVPHKMAAPAAAVPHRPTMKLREMDEKNMHNLFLKNMAGLIEEIKNPSPCTNPNSKRGGMATHAGVALELGIKRAGTGSGGIKMMSPQMEAILIWCQCRTRDYGVKIENFTSSWANGVPSAHSSITFSRNLSTSKRSIQIKGDRTTNLHSRPESVMLAFRIS